MWAMIAFAGRDGRGFLKHMAIPFLGFIANIVMLAGIIYLYIIGNADSQTEAHICFTIAGGWAVISAVYVLMSSARKGKAIVGAPRHA